MKATVQKKTYRLDSGLITRARRILDAKTDTEAIQRALAKVVDDREIENALDALFKAGRFRSIY